MGISKAGFNVHMACDALGYPLSCIITSGERHDVTQGKVLLKRHLKANGFALLDAGYDSNELRVFVEARESEAVIAYRKNRLEIPQL